MEDSSSLIEVLSRGEAAAMAYSDFTVSKVKQTFGISTLEGDRFLPYISPIQPSPALVAFLEEAFPLASLLKSEKAKSRTAAHSSRCGGLSLEAD